MKNTNPDGSNWTVEQARNLYGIKQWGGDYFAISDKGTVVVTPHGASDKKSAICLMDVVAGLRERGLNMPVLLRFGDILNSQIKTLHQSFYSAIDQSNYQGSYRGVYPVKVNQQQHVLEEIARIGKNYGHGLEAGSKPELIAAMTYMPKEDALLICNGYKDEEFIDLALYAQKLGIYSIIVIETMGEIPIIVERSKALNIKPHIGIRVKLSSKAGGHWQESGGDRSVFGLNTAQIIDTVDILRQADMLDCLELLHYHLGSQIPDIRDIRNATIEASRVYSGLVKEGAPMGLLDIGGGLAIDYMGSQTSITSSCNYSLKEYCTDIVETIQAVLNEDEVAHPTIVSESGRATVAHHSILLFNILDASRLKTRSSKPDIPDDAHQHVKDMFAIASSPITPDNCQECYNDAIYYRDMIRQLFKHGNISLRERAAVEEIFWDMMHNIAAAVKLLEHIPDDFKGIENLLADIYYGNFSVFQSLPDSWAIDQLFPIMPIHRLEEAPARESIISDITCDCDGTIDQFIGTNEAKKTIHLHNLKNNDEYYIGAFLVGAYQETLGDLHNLMGDTNVVSIRLDEDGGIEFEREIEGDSVSDVLSYVEYDPKAMAVAFKKQAERAVRKKLITPAERRKIVEAFNTGLQGYTYYER